MERMKSLYERGWTLREIASKYKCSPYRVRCILLKNGVKMRHRGRRSRKEPTRKSFWHFW